MKSDKELHDEAWKRVPATYCLVHGYQSNQRCLICLDEMFRILKKEDRAKNKSGQFERGE